MTGTTAGRSRAIRRTVLLGVTGAMILGFGIGSVVAASGRSTVTAAPDAEAWYRSVPAADECSLPVGCPGVPAAANDTLPAHAPGTLHVGVAAGREESRTYLSLDLTAIPGDADVLGGVLHLPVAEDREAGTAAPEVARMQACLVTEPVEDGVDGSSESPPEIDCTIAAPAGFLDGAEERPAAFTVDLGPFVEAWRTGVAALALVPTDDVEPTDTWHVAFSRRDREADGAVPIVATFSIVEVDGDPVDHDGAGQAVPAIEPPFVDDGAEVPVPTPSVDFDRPTSPLIDPPTPQGAEEVALPAEPRLTSPVTPAAVVLDDTFSHPGVFLVPLVVIVAGAWAAQAFTRDLAPRTN